MTVCGKLKIKRKGYFGLKGLLQWAVAGGILLHLFACAGVEPPVQKRYFWPPLSDDPKIEYIEFFQADTDVLKRSMNPLVDAVFGRERPKPLFRNPYDVYADGQGRLYVSEVAEHRVLAIDLHKGEIKTLVDAQGQTKEMSLPTAIAGDDQGNIYVVDSPKKMILVFGPDRRLRSEWQVAGAERLLGVAVDASRGRLYVCDVEQDKVFILNLQGEVLKSFGKEGGGPGDFSFPLDIALDGVGNLYVLDSMNARVQVFSPDGVFVREFGERGTALGSFQIPKGIAVTPAGQVYVTDSLAHRLVVFSLEGDFLLTLGGKFVAKDGEMAPGGFYMPGGIGADSANGIWVVDSLNKMVHHLQYLDDAYLRAHPVLPGQAVIPELR